MAKILTTQQTYLVIAYNNLKNTPPKEFPNADEMEKLSKIMEVLKEFTGKHDKITEKVKSIQREFTLEKITEKEANEKLGGCQRDLRRADLEIEGKEVIAELEDEYFNRFFDMVTRWSKNWFGIVEDYLKFKKDMEKANSAPKEEKKK